MKKISSRIIFGSFTGITIGFLIALAFSFIYRSSNFVPSTPLFMRHFVTNTQATAVSAVLWMLMGIVFSVSSLIFEQEKWSITKQATVHFLVSYLGFTPLALLAGWFPINFDWLSFYTLIFILIYAMIWLASMITAKKEVDRLNRLIKETKK